MALGEMAENFGLTTSKLRYNAVLEDVICSGERNLNKDTLLKLMDCSFIDRAENLLIDGKTGCGKSFLAVIVTSQLPIAKWYDYINEPTLANAIMDRLLANATRIELKGDSMRRKNK